MDYEKKYKEALELARLAAFNGHQSLMEGIFPELKESEDEKIRKWIINEIKIKHHNLDEDNVDFVDKAIAWLENIPYTIDHEKREGFHLGYKAGLEKQGDSPIKWNKNTKDNKPQVNYSVLMKTTHGIAEGEWKGEYWEQYRWAGIVKDSDVLSWMELSDLEKPGEQKPTLRERYKNIAESEWFKKTHEGMSVSDDEKVDNVNKIEPKFNVGDWVVNTVGDTNQVVKVLDDGYTLDDNTFLSNSWATEHYHLWTIQDAKDGDVLAEDTCTFIIKKLNDDLSAEIYCCLYDDGDFELNFNLGFDDTCTYPATKEQRDLLFQKMKEAGYEWDAEKKELKKIDARKNITLDGDLMEADCMIVEQKSADWSEEDEHRVKDTIYFLDTAKKHYASTVELDACINWLKSLKQRIGE